MIRKELIDEAMRDLVENKVASAESLAKEISEQGAAVSIHSVSTGELVGRLADADYAKRHMKELAAIINRKSAVKVNPEWPEQ